MKHGALPARLFAVRKGSPTYSELLPSSGGTTTKTPGFSRDNRPANRLVQQAARKLRTQAGDLLCVRQRECRWRPIVKGGQQARRLATCGLAGGYYVLCS